MEEQSISLSPDASRASIDTAVATSAFDEIEIIEGEQMADRCGPIGLTSATESHRH